ncbi:hypothetical protein Cus16_0737 [Curtobacterium sp. ER1/6]|nr:hypothetical protein Cus16_0737 [Curtobacterium sp. ER1/6]
MTRRAFRGAGARRTTRRTGGAVPGRPAPPVRQRCGRDVALPRTGPNHGTDVEPAAETGSTSVPWFDDAAGGAAPGASVRDAEAGAVVRRALDLVDDGDRVVRAGDVRVALGVGEEQVVRRAVGALPLAGVPAAEGRGRAHVEPVDVAGVVTRAERLEDLAVALRLGLDLVRELGRVDERRAALGDEQRARAADDAEPCSGSGRRVDEVLELVLELTAVRLDRRQRDDDDVGVLRDVGDEGGVEGVALREGEALGGVELGGVAGDGGDGDAAGQGLADDGGAGVPGAAEDDDAGHVGSSRDWCTRPYSRYSLRGSRHLSVRSGGHDVSARVQPLRGGLPLAAAARPHR